LRGVVRTRVGYSGGSAKGPTYHDLGDHSEAIQIDFDPAMISYRELLDIFWTGHDPARSSWSRQYRAAIFYHHEAQRKLALAAKDHLAYETQGEIVTAIEPYSGFTVAEDYHQKHSLRLFPEIMMEFRSIYPKMKSFIDSTAVSRLNGYLGGFGSYDSLKEDVEKFGLSRRSREVLTAVVCGRKASGSCPAQ